MGHRVLALVLAAAAAAGALWVGVALAQDEGGGRISGRVSLTRHGEPVAEAMGAVVYVTGFEEPAPKRPAKLVQEGRTFSPALLPVTRGTQVDFPNRDKPTAHNVFSPQANFNLGMFDGMKGKFPSRVMDGKLGPVDIFCNIHPEMAATILVLPNRRFTVTDRDGAFEIRGVPPGTWDVFAYDRHALVPARGKVTVEEGKTAELSFALNQTRFDFSHKRFHGDDYPKEYGGKKH